MIELSPKFKSALGTSRTTTIYPVLRIYKGVRIDQENQDFEGQSDGVINLSIKDTNLSNFNGEYENYLPLLLKSPSLKTSADLINNKFTISNVSVEISNYKYAGQKFSDNVVDYLKSVCQLFYVANGIDSIEDSLLVYTGTIRRFDQRQDSIRLQLEDYTQQIMSANVPSTLIPDDKVQYDENVIGKPYPAVYGHVNASPLIYNKFERLEIDKPEQNIEGDWESPTTIDYQNEAINDNHPLKNRGYLLDKAHLSVYDGAHLYIPQKGVVGWGSRRYASGDLNYSDLEFYNFMQSDTNQSASFVLNSESLVYSEYEEINGKLEGTGSLGIPARVYRPLEKVTFFSESHTTYQYPNSDDRPLNSVNKFIGYQNNRALADKVVQEYKNWFDGGADTWQTSYMQNLYNEDWGTDSPSMYWWQPTTLNENVNYDGEKRWSSKDDKWLNAGMIPEFPVQWIQNNNQGSGLHIYSINTVGRATGSFARLQVKTGVGSYPCVTKIFYDISYFQGDGEYGGWEQNYNVYPTQFWCEKQLAKRPLKGANSFNDFTNNSSYHWERNRGDIQSNTPDDWYTPANVPNHQHYFKDIDNYENPNPSEEGETHECGRIDTHHNEQFRESNVFQYINIIKGWNSTTGFDSIQWGASGHTGRENEDYQAASVIANLKNIYIIQDVLVDQMYEKNFYANVGGRLDENGDRIDRIEFIMKDILSNELDFEQNIEENTAFDGWKYDFTLSEQKEVKQIFEGLFKSSIGIPTYNNFGQFKLIPIHQVLDNVTYQLIESKDVHRYNFTLTKLDDIKHQVNVKYNKNYASGELEDETGYSLYVEEIEEFFETYDAMTQELYDDESLHYNIDYYGLKFGEAKLDVESEYIRDETTARKLQKRLVSFYANQHLILKCDLPVKYLGLESGDYIRLDQLINDDKVFGYDYTQPQIKNGQYIYPVFFITNISKSIDKVSIEAIQVHRGEYGMPDNIVFGDDEGTPFISDNGGNNGNFNTQLSDPFDDPVYSEETINTEESTPNLFDISLTGNSILNNGLVTITVSESMQSDWSYLVYLTKISTIDGTGITFEDTAGQSYTIPDGDYTESNQPQFGNGATAANLLHISTSTSDLADNFNGQILISKLWAIEPISASMEFEIKVFPLSMEGITDSSYTKFANFKQLGENVNYPMGDVNGDYITNVLDVVRLVKIINETATNVEDGELERGDMNDDGITNILDIVILVNLILGQ